MFRGLFRPDSALMITMTQITDCIFLSIFWILGCFPVITVGASTAALYDAVWRTFRRGEKNGWQRFAQSFRSNLKGSLIPCAVFLAGCGALVKGGVWIWNQGVYGNVSWGVVAACGVVMLLICGMGSILFPLLSRFETTAFQLLANTLRLGMANLPLTMALGLLNMATVFICLVYVIPLFFLPALSALIGTLLIEPMFRPFMPKEETEEETEAV